MTATEQLLEQMLSVSVDESIENEATFYDRATRGMRQAVLYGSGNLGKRVFRFLGDVQELPIAFCDSNPSLWGSFIEGVPVMSPDDAASLYGETATFIICTWSPGQDRTHPAIFNRLRLLGCRSVVSFIPLFWKYHEKLLPYNRVDLPHLLLAAKDQVREAHSILNDERSKEEFVRQVGRLLADHLDALDEESPEEDIYFPEGLFTLTDHEFFVDCGAFDGDTLRPFLKAVNNLFSGVHAFEPDPENLRSLRDFIKTLSPDAQSKIVTSGNAVSDTVSTFMLDAQGSVSSCISDRGTVEISSVVLDDVITEPVSYMKMDIEGFEPMALCGAKRIIQTYAPRLAVCMYHRQDHLWTLPLQIKSYHPDYKLYIRRHGTLFDLVCYAVP